MFRSPEVWFCLDLLRELSAPGVACFANLPCSFYDVNCTKHYPYLNGEVSISNLEVLHPVLHPVDGVVVALAGGVVHLSRPC